MTQPTEAKAKAGALIIPVTLFEQNCMLLWCEATRKAVVIDPGGDVDKIQAAIKQSNVTVENIWLTHGHIDHVGGAAELRDALKVEIIGPHIDDKFLTDNVVMSGLRFGMAGVRDFVPDRWLTEGDQVRVGELTFDVLPRPFAGQCGVLQQGDALRPCRRRAVQRLGRTHRSARRRSRHSDPVDHRQAAAARR
jgi:hydroxyacylglutathione hydrolase